MQTINRQTDSETVCLKQIRVTPTEMGSRIDYEYSAPELLNRYIKEDYLQRNEGLFVEVPGDASGIPEAVLAIPFVGVMLTVSVVLGYQIDVPSIEKSFFDSLKNITGAYEEMFPGKGLRVSVNAQQICEVDYKSNEDKTGLLFTGGVDATAALAVTRNKHPLLINIWGGDIRLTDQDSHEQLQAYFDRLTDSIGERYCFIKTNAREMFEENELGTKCEMLGHRNNHGWWASIAHILSMASTAAPLVYAEGIRTIFIGSSWDGSTTDSNNELFVKAICYGETRFEIVDEYVDRNEKIGKIIKFRNDTAAPIELKVCWRRTAGKNCCKCEKCYRTIMGIICNHGDPNEFGFETNDETIQSIRSFLRRKNVNLGFWGPIVKTFKNEESFWKENKSISWILRIKLNSPFVYFNVFKERLKQLVDKALK